MPPGITVRLMNFSVVLLLLLATCSSQRGCQRPTKNWTIDPSGRHSPSAPSPNSQRLNERLSSVIFSRRSEQLGNSGLRFNRYHIHSRLPRNKSQHKNFWIKSQIDSQLALQSKDRVEIRIRRRYKSPADAITGQNKHLFEQEGVGI